MITRQELKEVFEKYKFIIEENREYLDFFSVDKESNFFERESIKNLGFTLKNLEFLDGIDKKDVDQIIISFYHLVNSFPRFYGMEKYFKLINEHFIPFILLKPAYLQTSKYLSEKFFAWDWKEMRKVEDILDEWDKKPTFPNTDQEKKLFFKHQEMMLVLFLNSIEKLSLKKNLKRVIRSFVDYNKYKTDDLIRGRYLISDFGFSKKYAKKFFWKEDNAPTSILEKISKTCRKIGINTKFSRKLGNVLSPWSPKFHSKEYPYYYYSSIFSEPVEPILLIFFVKKFNLNQELFTQFLDLIVELEKQSEILNIESIIQNAVEDPSCISNYLELIRIILKIFDKKNIIRKEALLCI